METNLFGDWETKALEEDGTFEGHAAISGNLDLGGDVLEKDAIKEIHTNQQGNSVVLWQHRVDTPIASALFTPDSKGLRVRGRIVMKDPQAMRAYEHMKAGTVTAMSFGYDVLPGGATFDKSGVRRLKAVKVWEASLVTFGMNPKAGIERVKAMAENIANIREFETFLRDVGGFSVKQAKRIASRGWSEMANDVREEQIRGQEIDVFMQTFLGVKK